MQSEITQLIKNLETAFNLPAMTLVPKTGKTGRPRNCNGVNVAEIRKALIVYASLELRINGNQFERWFGYDHGNFSRHLQTGKGFLQRKDNVFMRHYNLIRELASEQQLKQAS